DYDRSGNVIQERHKSDVTDWPTQPSNGTLTYAITYDNGGTFGYDGLNRTTGKQETVFLGDPHTTGPTFYLTTYSYDDRHNTVVTSNPRSNDPSDPVFGTGQIETRRDGLDRLYQQTVENVQGINFVTRFGYDANGDQASVIDAEGHETVTLYDGLGRKLRVT